ncbi:unnamed protein product [Paramecium primaurelia]|uniref:P-type ATPase A domain-containing protein n=1 Tax=Paramecium primaurelia TaxID=5886 RepID=A0A8S1KGS5_PARPR|nr:unnamed protein product [Paramecium primaurelia]
MVLYQQFKFCYHAIIIYSQLKVGFLFSYVAPFAFVLILTLLIEAYDDFQRYKRDKQANSQVYTQIEKDKTIKLQSWQLKVGDIIEVHANQRIPADLILLNTNDITGTVFIRADQLNGEKDWKLCKAIRHTQNFEDNLKIFTAQYEKAKNQMGERGLANDLELLELIGVEDMLQKDIDATLESLKNAGIQIWMLTGDKVETAQCIAISTGLKSPTQEMFVIKDIEDSLILKKELNQFAPKNNSVLVLDEQSLKVSLEFQYTAFFHVACNSPAVVCWRFSPTQKAQVTELIKEQTQKIVLCFGDGGNDVAMIQAADVGVGLVSKQVALASEFSVLSLSIQMFYYYGMVDWLIKVYLKWLNSSCIEDQFIVSRQTIFSIVLYFVFIPIYNGWLMLEYGTVQHYLLFFLYF